MEKTIFARRYASPCGELILGSFDGRLCMCDWTCSRKHARVEARLCRLLGARIEEEPGAQIDRTSSEILETAVAQLDEYFSGSRRLFSVPLLFAGSEFQRAVWSALEGIPYGQTVSYAVQASRLGMPRAVRAVAGANGVNAISIFVPCHRVVGSDGTLTGYGGGLDAKRALLALENRAHENL